jgi:hypothetical protein
MRYAVYQIQVDPLDSVSMYAKAEAMVRADVKPGLTADLYRKVAEIEADDLEHCFDIGNIGPEDRITRSRGMSSISVGDIIQDADGVRSVVASFGFNDLPGRFD